MAEPSAAARGSNLAALRLNIDGIKFGRFIACRLKSGALEFEGSEAVRSMVGNWAVEFTHDSPRSMLVRSMRGE